ncbi:MAG TPA: glycosyltransferase family 1 protein, partial [Cellulomonas sp.]
VRRAREDVTSAPTWLLLTALTGAMPDDAAVRSTRRLLATEPVDAAAAHLLDDALTGLRWSDPLVEIEVLQGAVLVDVDYSARHDLNTGIQRAVRHTVPRWSRDHTVTLVAWASFEAYRRLDAVEAGRVLTWSGPVGEPPQPGRTRHVVVPWRSVVLLPEVPASRACPPLAALAEHSGNRVGLVGYDCIPVISADLMPPQEPERFVHYLTVVKHADHVCGISAAAAEEFRGFADMMVSQGLPGPVVTQCQLPVDAPPEPVAASSDPSSAPLVLVVGSHEPRKNHLGVLHASEVLWREGLTFSLRFVGGSSWASGPFDKQVARLRRNGRDVATQRGVGDTALWAAYRAARFTIFTSVHEGYGLPVAESLAVGTPVITSDLGPMREIAAGGGTILVDPRDDAALTDAMRRLLTDDEVRSRLARQAAQRTLRTWDDFAADAWDQLVAARLQEGRPA